MAVVDAATNESKQEPRRSGCKSQETIIGTKMLHLQINVLWKLAIPQNEGYIRLVPYSAQIP